MEFSRGINVNTRYTVPPHFQSIWQMDHHEYAARNSYSGTVEQYRKFRYLITIYHNLAILLQFYRSILESDCNSLDARRRVRRGKTHALK